MRRKTTIERRLENLGEQQRKAAECLLWGWQ